ncbi:acyl-CoA dehydrogenase family protein [Novosphingobium album (ex Liu et al. 2023)]|uniref:Acyl-CoA dehydrogenase family protein n=1 Tax=Novosphingobium album (ex Liu et al. 2023) TaxID=3031130 RepID=A0ABT5WLW9_9SPHN|nr:acyl-CoA dehydrogenase family protein [Novosphingobium album (ex Liu et al. 2023)]MDE8651050.1 acyl-CoA dehydrogenase family protein [Novosphingobium album (ex Liu et al. 2023)]
MLLSLNEDQTQILDFIDSLARPYAGVPMHDVSLALTSAELDAALVENGFLDVMAVEELGPVTAALVIEKLARLPFAIEAAASAMVRPLIDPELPRPLCLVEEGQTRKPLRFLKPGASVVMVGPSGVRSFTATAEMIGAAQEDTLYGYPVAFLTALPEAMTAHDAEPAEVLRAWRVAIAAEAAGLLGAALASTVIYVSERKQFGRPLATFQGMRHRLAEDQVMTNTAYWLALRAAGTGDAGDAALALLHAQDAAKRVCYDFHQFLGGMGITLEHPLHLWTYRLKLLSAELGGRGGQGLAAAEAIWG